MVVLPQLPNEGRVLLLCRSYHPKLSLFRNKNICAYFLGKLVLALGVISSYQLSRNKKIRAYFLSRLVPALGLLLVVVIHQLLVWLTTVLTKECGV